MRTFLIASSWGYLMAGWLFSVNAIFAHDQDLFWIMLATTALGVLFRIAANTEWS